MADGGTLDLSQLAAAPLKVKLPDGQLYAMADPESLGILPTQRLVASWRRAQEILSRPDAGEDDVEEMMSLFIDVAQTILPAAPRELVGQLDLVRLERLVEAFFDASPMAKQAAAEATPRAQTSGS